MCDRLRTLTLQQQSSTVVTNDVDIIVQGLYAFFPNMDGDTRVEHEGDKKEVADTSR